MKDCWIDQKGKIYEVGDCMHNDFASEFLEKEMGGYENLYEYMNKNNISYPYQVLHKRGWVRVKYNTAYLPKVEILGDCISLASMQRNTMYPAMNSRQMRVAKLICEEVGEDFHRAINDKRFW